MPVTRTKIEDIRRRDLIEAAYQTFREYGLNGMTMARISKRAGLSQSIVNYYFKSKDELVFAVVQKAYFGTMSQIARALRITTSPRDRVRVIIEANFNPIIFTTDGSRAWVEFFGAIWKKPELAHLQRVFDRRITSNLTHAMAQIMPRDEARKIASMIVILIDGHWTRKACAIGDLTPSEAVEHIVQIVDLRIASVLSEESRHD